MTANAFPDARLHQAAAATYRELVKDLHDIEVDGYLPDLAERGIDTGNGDHAELRGRIATIVRAAADVSEWAVELGATGLAPCHAHAWHTTTGEDFAVQLAAGEALKPAFRRVLTTAIHAAVEGVYEEFLNQVPKTHVPAALR